MNTAFLLSGSIFFRRLHITFATFDWQLSLSRLHTASKICAFVNTLPGLVARQQSAPYSKRVRGMSVPFFNTRRWCNFISNPGKVSTGEWGGCMASSGIISARAAMAFSTAFSSVSLNVSMTIFPTNTTSRHAAPFSQNGTVYVMPCRTFTMPV